MNKLFLLFLIFFCTNLLGQSPSEYLTRQGQVTFFSYTTVENIEATNKQVLSLFKTDTDSIAVRMLMRAFSFKKSLMQEHFNESYIESDKYPEATFRGRIIDFDPNFEGTRIFRVSGEFGLRDIKKLLEFSINCTNQDGEYSIAGDLEVLVDDYNIKIPTLLAPNIAQVIKVSFNFQY